jgi:hypothetical protein
VNKDNSIILAPPKGLGPNPETAITKLDSLAAKAPDVSSTGEIIRGLDLADLADKWTKKFGSQGTKVKWAARACRLSLERRLGELLPPTEIVRAEVGGKLRGRTPRYPGIAKDLASDAQTLACADPEFLDGVIQDVRHGRRMYNHKKLIVEIRRRSKRVPPVVDAEDSIEHGDFVELTKKIPDNSIPLIIADPPWAIESQHLYADVAVMAQRVLQRGGSLIVYATTNALADVIEEIRKAGLRYHWQIILPFTPPLPQIQSRCITSTYRSLLWSTKGAQINSHRMVADTIACRKEKDWDNWQQSIDAPLYLIERLTQRGELVLDPMCGAGTVVVAALQLGRKALGMDKCPHSVANARKRVREAKKQIATQSHQPTPDLEVSGVA